MQTRLFLLCICIGSYLSGIAQSPVNDNCINATVISLLDGTCTVNVDNTNAVEDMGPGACTVGANENVWFSFVADGVSAQIVVSNGIGTPEITVIHFPTTPCNIADGQEIDCSTGSPLLLDNQLTIGDVYYVMVAFSNNPDGLFDICIDNPEPAPNDECIDAITLSNIDGICSTYDNDFPSTDILIPSCFTGTTYNVWFSFQAQGVSLDAYVPAGGPGVGQIAVIDFTGATCNFTGAVVLGCETAANHIVLDNQLVIGNIYHVIVGFQNTDFNGNGTGDFELCVDNPVPIDNDFCDDAIIIPSSVLDDPNTCFNNIAGFDLNNDFPSTDIGTFSCWNVDDSYNVWYSFVSQGNDVQIEVDPSFNSDAQIALVEFTGAPCDIAGAQVLECANGTVLDYNDDLVIGNTYFIAVGFEDNGIGDYCMNVFNPVPPPNDLPCDAIFLPTTGNCIDGTTIYANPEPYNVPAECEFQATNTVWYTLNLGDDENVGFEIDIDFADVNPVPQVSIILWEITDCNNGGAIAFYYCGPPPSEPFDFAPVDETFIYYLSVSTHENNETDFEICVHEIPPCFTNDICEEATVIDNVMSDAAFVCIEGCNLYADPELFESCGTSNFPTVWFQVNTDGAATLMNIQVTSDDFDAPTITLFRSISGCDDLVQIPLTQSDLPCITGSQGEAEALATDVGSSEIYYIAISSLNNVGGEFEICVNTISVASACVVQRDIEITSRSGSGPLTGPFIPGETIGICMNVDSYTASGNGCQWFQGLVPIFGNGWDPSSFDANGQPLGATVNGQPIGAPGNGIYGASTWDWFDDVGYHHDNIFFQIGDLDGNGTVEMCNILYDPDCPNLGGIQGGCCGACWDDPGDILPPGWFAYGIDGNCPIPGPPIAVDYGDGNTCGCCMGPWSFCFELIIREYPDCLEDNTTMDLTLGFFTFADGEVGTWTGGASVCALDQPAKITPPLCCTELEEDNDELDPICSGDVIVYGIDQPGVDFWQWTVTAGSVTGATPGQGGPGTLIINTLVNPTDASETVEYVFLGFAGGACPVFAHTVTVEVHPQIEVTLDPLLLCATPTTPYTIAPEVTGGSGTYQYLWSPGNEMTPSITIANPVGGTTYSVTVSDDVGCEGDTSMTITVYSTFPVEITAPTFEQCLQDGPITIEGSATDGIDPYNFLWSLPPDGNPFMGQSVTTDVTGHYVLVVTDNEGCIGRDSVDLLLFDEPDVYVDAVNGVLAICEGQSTELSGVATGGESPYFYYWDTPEGSETGKNIIAYTPGTYTVTVEDNNGCTNSGDVFIDDQPEPVPDLGPDIDVCNFEQEVEITVLEEYEDYAWSIGPAGDGLQTIAVFDGGTYTVTVTNEFGCTGETSIEIGLLPQPVFNLPDTFEMCAGSVLNIDSDDSQYGDGPWAYAIWAQCPSCVNDIDIFGPGDFQVTVFDDNDCSVYETFTVVETTTLSPGLTGPDVICTGNTITLSALPVFETYLWAPGGQTISTINVTAPGTYSVTVEDVNGCSGTQSHVVTSGDISTAISGPTSICAGVLAPLSVVGSFDSYLWSPSAGSATTQSVMVDEGIHSVTVTSSDGCTATATITIIETPFVPSITGDPMICQTSESSTLNAGGPYLNYQWSANAGGATTQTVTVSTAGTYSVTITDLATCVGTASFDVGNHPVPFVAISGNPDFCVGGNTEMSATSGYPFYAWNTLEVNDTITINTAGNYVVTVTDANGCTNTATTTVNPPYQETVDIIGSVVFCPGGFATLAVPPGYASVLWSTNETTDQIFVSTEGPISVTVVDTDGCIASDMVVTDANAVLVPDITGDTAICDVGTATLNAGPGFETYDWSNGDDTQIITVTTPGTYTVTVGISTCTGTDDFIVSSYTTPTATITSTASACSVQEPGGPSTSINFNSLITAGDNSGPWVQASGPSSVNLSNLANVNFNGLTPGTYTFTYTTSTAIVPCVDQPYTLTVTVNDCACPAVDVGLAPDLCNDLGTVDLCSLVTGVTGGTWTIVSAPPGSNPVNITGCNLDATSADFGLYTLQYSVSGLPSYCPNSVTTTVNVLRTPDAGSAAAPAQFCAGENQTVTLSTLLISADTGGTWVETSTPLSTGGAFDPVTGKFITTTQAPGIYTFEYIVAGAGNCPDDVVTVTVEIENNPVADAGETATLDCNQSSTILGGNGSSTGSDFSYRWTTIGGALQDSTQLHATATRAGTYILTVTNNITGCLAVDQVVIDQIGDFPTEMDILVQSPDCEGDPPGNAQVSAVTGGVEPYSYSLNEGPPVASPVFPNLSAGDYQIEVTDATGCSLKDSFTIEELVEVDLEIINYVNDTFIFAFGDTIKLSYLFSGTSDIPDSVVWKLGDSVICINCPFLELKADLAGKITLVAYDVRGCVVSRSITYIVVRNRDVFIPNVFSPNNDGVNDWFTLFTDADVKEISMMEVYTRWGDLVYRSPGPFSPNIKELGWDGTFNGETLNPGVYVYRIEILYGDNLREKLAGDITIIR